MSSESSFPPSFPSFDLKKMEHTSRISRTYLYACCSFKYDWMKISKDVKNYNFEKAYKMVENKYIQPTNDSFEFGNYVSER